MGYEKEITGPTGPTGSELLNLESLVGISGGFTINKDEISSSTGSTQFNITNASTGIPSKDTTQLLTYSVNDIREGIFSLKSEITNYADNLVIKTKSPTAQRIIRTHFLTEILNTIKWISENHEPKNPLTANHISILFENILLTFKKNNDDPFSSYLIALYDGLAFENRWIDIDKNIFKKILQQVQNLGDREFKDYKIIDKEILKLESWGINTTPYS